MQAVTTPNGWWRRLVPSYRIRFSLMTPSALIALETATDVCGVALAQAGRVTVELTLSRPRAHAENLVPLIADALRYAGLPVTALDAVAVSQGPGSYTGLRIGVSTAKGLAMAVGARLIGVPSLAALAHQAAPAARPGDFIGAAFNARRDEVYAAVYAVGEAGALTPVVPETACAPAELPARLPAHPPGCLWLTGEGAPALAQALTPALTGYPRIKLLPVSVSAAAVARLALTRDTGEDLATFEPFYLKAFVARRRTRSVYDRLPF